MVCLGAFTESWIRDFALSRQMLTYLYFATTFCVFFSLKWWPCSYSIRRVLFLIGGSFLLAMPGTYCFPIIGVLGLVFFLLQSLGQGCCVQFCRIFLFQKTPSSRYSQTVGWMEALGTCTVFILPFFLLWILRFVSWHCLFIGLGTLYTLIAFAVPAKITLNAPAFSDNIHEKLRFWALNLIVYQPVVTTSGLFFHLENFCQTHAIDLSVLGLSTTLQITGSIGVQIGLGYLLGQKWYRLKHIYIMLILSQIIWLWSLFHFQWLGQMCYILSGMLSWGCFGLLVNVLWQHIYDGHAEKTIAGLRESVRFGFLANALGPCIFYFLL